MEKTPPEDWPLAPPRLRGPSSTGYPSFPSALHTRVHLELSCTRACVRHSFACAHAPMGVRLSLAHVCEFTGVRPSLAHARASMSVRLRSVHFPTMASRCTDCAVSALHSHAASCPRRPCAWPPRCPPPGPGPLWAEARPVGGVACAGVTGALSPPTGKSPGTESGAESAGLSLPRRWLRSHGVLCALPAAADSGGPSPVCSQPSWAGPASHTRFLQPRGPAACLGGLPPSSTRPCSPGHRPRLSARSPSGPLTGDRPGPAPGPGVRRAGGFRWRPSHAALSRTPTVLGRAGRGGAENLPTKTVPSARHPRLPSLEKSGLICAE